MHEFGFAREVYLHAKALNKLVEHKPICKISFIAKMCVDIYYYSRYKSVPTLQYLKRHYC